MVSLRSAGQDMNQDSIQKAIGWIVSRQHADGGWGESCETYENPLTDNCQASTASQTAWALMGLIAAGQCCGPSVEKGIKYLLEQQNPDGSWTEEAYTGTGFPKAFYLRYDLYRIYFPLIALSQYRSCQEVLNG